MRFVSDKSCTENQKTYLMFNNFYFQKSCHSWKNLEKYGTARHATDDKVILSMCFACWTTKARMQTHTQNM